MLGRLLVPFQHVYAPIHPFVSLVNPIITTFFSSSSSRPRHRFDKEMMEGVEGKRCSNVGWRKKKGKGKRKKRKEQHQPITPAAGKFSKVKSVSQAKEKETSKTVIPQIHRDWMDKSRNWDGKATRICMRMIIPRLRLQKTGGRDKKSKNKI